MPSGGASPSASCLAGFGHPSNVTKCNQGRVTFADVTPLDLSTLLAGLRQEGGDSTGVEVKSALGGLPATIGQSICALANRPGGGVVILGLDERADFAAVGLADLQALKQGLASRARMCEPPVVLEIEQAMVDGAPVVLARVSECNASAKPCRFQGRGWLREWASP